MKTIFTFVYLGGYLLISLVFGMKYKYLGFRGKKEAQANYLLKVSSRWGRNMVGCTGSKVTVIGAENIPEGAVLYVSNHQGYMDIPLLLGYLPKLKGLVAKIELSKLPIISKWMQRLGCIFLDRANLRQSIQVIMEGIEKLKNGHSMVIFPEGTRSKGGPVAEFKKGSLQLAVKSGVPIVPVTIDGSGAAYEATGKIKKASVKITVHPPIFMADLSQEQKKELAAMVYEIIRKPLL